MTRKLVERAERWNFCELENGGSEARFRISGFGLGIGKGGLHCSNPNTKMTHL